MGNAQMAVASSHGGGGGIGEMHNAGGAAGEVAQARPARRSPRASRRIARQPTIDRSMSGSDGSSGSLAVPEEPQWQLPPARLDQQWLQARLDEMFNPNVLNRSIHLTDSVLSDGRPLFLGTQTAPSPSKPTAATQLRTKEQENEEVADTISCLVYATHESLRHTLISRLRKRLSQLCREEDPFTTIFAQRIHFLRSMHAAMRRAFHAKSATSLTVAASATIASTGHSSRATANTFARDGVPRLALPGSAASQDTSGKQTTTQHKSATANEWGLDLALELLSTLVQCAMESSGLDPAMTSSGNSSSSNNNVTNTTISPQLQQIVEAIHETLKSLPPLSLAGNMASNKRRGSSKNSSVQRNELVNKRSHQTLDRLQGLLYTVATATQSECKVRAVEALTLLACLRGSLVDLTVACKVLLHDSLHQENIRTTSKASIAGKGSTNAIKTSSSGKLTNERRGSRSEQPSSVGKPFAAARRRRSSHSSLKDASSTSSFGGSNSSLNNNGLAEIPNSKQRKGSGVKRARRPSGPSRPLQSLDVVKCLSQLGTTRARDIITSAGIAGGEPRQVWTCGQNSYGELGHGDTTSRKMPALVAPNVPRRHVIQVAAGNEHTVILMDNGTVYTVGYNDNGQCGHEINGRVGAMTMVQGLHGHRITQVHAYNGCEHTLCVTSEGKVFAFGYNYRGQLGLGTTASVVVPTLVRGLGTPGRKVNHVSCSYYHTVVSTEGGHMFSFGRNDYGQLGLGDVMDRKEPALVSSLSNQGLEFLAVGCGQYHTTVSVKGGKFYSCGKNDYGQLGLETHEPVRSFTLVASLAEAARQASEAAAVPMGQGVSEPLMSPHRRRDREGEFGAGHSTIGARHARDRERRRLQRQAQNQQFLHDETPPTEFVQIRCGYYHTMVLSSTNRIWCFGRNDYGQLGLGHATQRVFGPRVLEALDDKHVVKITAGCYHSMAVSGNGTIYVFGRNNHGQLGTGDTVERHTPFAVDTFAGKHVSMVAAGFYHTIILTGESVSVLESDSEDGDGHDGNGSTTNADIGAEELSARAMVHLTSAANGAPSWNVGSKPQSPESAAAANAAANAGIVIETKDDETTDSHVSPRMKPTTHDAAAAAAQGDEVVDVALYSAVSVLSNLDRLASRQLLWKDKYPAGEGAQTHLCSKCGRVQSCKQTREPRLLYCVDTGPKGLSNLVDVLVLCRERHLCASVATGAGHTSSPTASRMWAYAVSACLRLIHANLSYILIAGVGARIRHAAVSGCDSGDGDNMLLLAAVRDLHKVLFSILENPPTAQVRWANVMAREATDVIMVGLELFYPTQEHQVQLLGFLMAQQTGGECGEVLLGSSIVRWTPRTPRTPRRASKEVTPRTQRGVINGKTKYQAQHKATSDTVSQSKTSLASSTPAAASTRKEGGNSSNTLEGESGGDNDAMGPPQLHKSLLGPLLQRLADDALVSTLVPYEASAPATALLSRLLTSLLKNIKDAAAQVEGYVSLLLALQKHLLNWASQDLDEGQQDADVGGGATGLSGRSLAVDCLLDYAEQVLRQGSRELDHSRDLENMDQSVLRLVLPSLIIGLALSSHRSIFALKLLPLVRTLLVRLDDKCMSVSALSNADAKYNLPTPKSTGRRERHRVTLPWALELEKMLASLGGRLAAVIVAGPVFEVGMSASALTVCADSRASMVDGAFSQGLEDHVASKSEAPELFRLLNDEMFRDGSTSGSSATPVSPQKMQRSRRQQHQDDERHQNQQHQLQHRLADDVRLSDPLFPSNARGADARHMPRTFLGTSEFLEQLIQGQSTLPSYLRKEHAKSDHVYAMSLTQGRANGGLDGTSLDSMENHLFAALLKHTGTALFAKMYGERCGDLKRLWKSVAKCRIQLLRFRAQANATQQRAGEPIGGFRKAITEIQALLRFTLLFKAAQPLTFHPAHQPPNVVAVGTATSSGTGSHRQNTDPSTTSFAERSLAVAAAATAAAEASSSTKPAQPARPTRARNLWTRLRSRFWVSHRFRRLYSASSVAWTASPVLPGAATPASASAPGVATAAKGAPRALGAVVCTPPGSLKVDMVVRLLHTPTQLVDTEQVMHLVVQSRRRAMARAAGFNAFRHLLATPKLSSVRADILRYLTPSMAGHFYANLQGAGPQLLECVGVAFAQLYRDLARGLRVSSESSQVELSASATKAEATENPKTSTEGSDYHNLAVATTKFEHDTKHQQDGLAAAAAAAESTPHLAPSRQEQMLLLDAWTLHITPVELKLLCDTGMLQTLQHVMGPSRSKGGKQEAAWMLFRLLLVQVLNESTDAAQVRPLTNTLYVELESAMDELLMGRAQNEHALNSIVHNSASMAARGTTAGNPRNVSVLAAPVRLVSLKPGPRTQVTLKTTSSPNNFSISFWLCLQQAATGRKRSVLMCGNAGSSAGECAPLLMLREGDNRLEVQVGSTTTIHERFVSKEALVRDTWTHVAVVFEGIKLRIFLNGNMDSQHSFSIILGGPIHPSDEVVHKMVTLGKVGETHSKPEVGSATPMGVEGIITQVQYHTLALSPIHVRALCDKTVKDFGTVDDKHAFQLLAIMQGLVGSTLGREMFSEARWIQLNCKMLMHGTCRVQQAVLRSWRVVFNGKHGKDAQIADTVLHCLATEAKEVIFTSFGLLGFLLEQVGLALTGSPRFLLCKFHKPGVLGSENAEANIEVEGERLCLALELVALARTIMSHGSHSDVRAVESAVDALYQRAFVPQVNPGNESGEASPAVAGIGALAVLGGQSELLRIGGEVQVTGRTRGTVVAVQRAGRTALVVTLPDAPDSASSEESAVQTEVVEELVAMRMDFSQIHPIDQVSSPLECKDCASDTCMHRTLLAFAIKVMNHVGPNPSKAECTSGGDGAWVGILADQARTRSMQALLGMLEMFNRQLHQGQPVLKCLVDWDQSAVLLNSLVRFASEHTSEDAFVTQRETEMRVASVRLRMSCIADVTTKCTEEDEEEEEEETKEEVEQSSNANELTIGQNGETKKDESVKHDDKTQPARKQSTDKQENKGSLMLVERIHSQEDVIRPSRFVLPTRSVSCHERQIQSRTIGIELEQLGFPHTWGVLAGTRCKSLVSAVAWILHNLENLQRQDKVGGIFEDDDTHGSLIAEDTAALKKGSDDEEDFEVVRQEDENTPHSLSFTPRDVPDEADDIDVPSRAPSGPGGVMNSTNGVDKVTVSGARDPAAEHTRRERHFFGDRGNTTAVMKMIGESSSEGCAAGANKDVDSSSTSHKHRPQVPAELVDTVIQALDLPALATQAHREEHNLVLMYARSCVLQMLPLWRVWRKALVVTGGVFEHDPELVIALLRLLVFRGPQSRTTPYASEAGIWASLSIEASVSGLPGLLDPVPPPQGSLSWLIQSKYPQIGAGLMDCGPEAFQDTTFRNHLDTLETFCVQAMRRDPKGRLARQLLDTAIRDLVSIASVKQSNKKKEQAPRSDRHASTAPNMHFATWALGVLIGESSPVLLTESTALSLMHVMSATQDLEVRTIALRAFSAVLRLCSAKVPVVAGAAPDAGPKLCRLVLDTLPLEAWQRIASQRLLVERSRDLRTGTRYLASMLELLTAVDAAQSASNHSVPTATATAVQDAEKIPSATELRVNKVEATALELTWDRGPGCHSTKPFVVSLEPPPPNSAGTFHTSELSLRVDGLVANTEYSIRVCNTHTHVHTLPSEAFPFTFDARRCGPRVKLSADNTKAKFSGSESWSTLLGSHGFMSGRNSWSIKIEDSSTAYLFIGVASANVSVTSFLGGDKFGWGFIGDRAVYHNRNKLKTYGDRFGKGDVIGVTLDMDQGTLAYSCNGRTLGVAVHGLAGELFPAVAFYNTGQTVSLVPDKFDCPGAGVKTVASPNNPTMPQLVESARLLGAVARRSPLPMDKLQQAHARYVRWSKGSVRRCRSLLGFDVDLDVSASDVDTRVQTGRGPATVVGRLQGRAWVQVDGDTGAWFLSGCGTGTELPSVSMTAAAGATSSSPVVDAATATLLSTSSSEDKAAGVAIAASAEKKGDVSLSTFAAMVSSDVWTLDMDALLVQHASALSDKQHISTWNITRAQLDTHMLPQLVKRWPQITSDLACARFAVMCVLNDHMAHLLPLVDTNHSRFTRLVATHTSDGDGDSDNEGKSGKWLVAGSLQMNVSQHLRLCAPLLFTPVTADLVNVLLDHTATPTQKPDDDYDYPDIVPQFVLSRPQAAFHRDHPDPLTRMDASLFGQIIHQLNQHGPQALRVAYTHPMDDGQRRAFRVKFDGEGADDYGGPYRECFAQVMAELCATKEDNPSTCILPLLQPSANRQHGTGDDRERFVTHPRNTGEYVEQLIGLGQVIGIAIRSQIKLSLNLSRSVWKVMVGDAIVPEDLAEYDHAASTMVKHIASGLLDDELFEWATTLSDGSTVPLVPAGENITLGSSSALGRKVESGVGKGDGAALARATLMTRLRESERAGVLIRAGLASVVPQHVLPLFTASQLEMLVCGSGTVDIPTLKGNTEYDDDVSPEEPHIEYLWNVLEEFDGEERQLFLRFVWARSRLPTNARDMVQKFKVQAPVGDGPREDPDTYLPKAHTCFFSLSLPRYSSQKVMKEKLLYAIHNCVEMDADFRVGDGDNLESWTV